MALHQNASNNPLGISSLTDRIRFHPYFTSKDLVGVIQAAQIFCIFIFYYPNYLGHSDNSIPANPLVTPHHIVPEWYFQPSYAILRAIPDKLGGVIAMFGAQQILMPQPFFTTQNARSNRLKPLSNLLFWIFVANFFALLWLGAKPISSPYIELGQICTFLYFSYFLMLFIIG